MAKHQRRTGTSDPAPVPVQSESANSKQTSHLEAIALYEAGIRQIQQHEFARAADLLSRVVTAFPHERELCERARLYLSLCDRQLRPAAAEPQSLAERIYAATLALNAGNGARAIDFLEGVLRQDPTNDQALYMLATAYAQRGDLEVAIPYLQQAIASNPDNRVLARVDPDLADLRTEDTIAALLESPLAPPPGEDRKRSARPRSAR
jgi:tetratricopeptide (TPR) repeat protein